MNDEPINPVVLKAPIHKEKTWAYPCIGIVFGVAVGILTGRALRILIVLIPVFAIPYVIALHRRKGLTGIWRKWADDRMREDLGTKKLIKLCIGWPQAFVVGLYFSVLSAFNIGWHEFNVGNWVQRLQANEYTLRASGWVRTVSGIQALISFYLLAIWALTYFSRLFE